LSLSPPLQIRYSFFILTLLRLGASIHLRPFFFFIWPNTSLSYIRLFLLFFFPPFSRNFILFSSLPLRLLTRLYRTYFLIIPLYLVNPCSSTRFPHPWALCRLRSSSTAYGFSLLKVSSPPKSLTPRRPADFSICRLPA